MRLYWQCACVPAHVLGQDATAQCHCMVPGQQWMVSGMLLHFNATIAGGVAGRYSQDQLYGVVAAVEHYREFVPWCQRSEIIQNKPPSFVEAELEVGFKMFVERCLPSPLTAAGHACPSVTAHEPLCAAVAAHRCQLAAANLALMSCARMQVHLTGAPDAAGQGGVTCL